ncbi:MAG: hypothetical protein AAFW70_04110 [Cyanobacteria bacterium J06635_10]
MKRQILSVTIAITTVLLNTFPVSTNRLKKVALHKVDRVEYQAVKIDNSIDAMLNPEQGGIRPMPPPPPWIPPVSEGMMNKMPPSYTPLLPTSEKYTPMRHLPPSAPWITPTVDSEDRIMNTPPLPIR